ncbi:MAG: GNAT family N-acetyltransferase [Anaerolineae bacterium]|nr:GNAT family N-acetyltransferase [Anaerolineae bacterium]MDW8297810.1 GNAT family N-acetyltransferase [Anaerolineae bacterium]
MRILEEPVIEIRPLTSEDIPNLPQIRPTYRTDTILAVERSGSGYLVSWRLTERRLDKPFDKGGLYDFTPEMQASIRERLKRGESAYQRVAVANSTRLVGLLDMTWQAWNQTAYIWNLMVDLDFRRRGIGRRLWHLAVRAAQSWNARAITLETQQTNIAACRFYAQMGCRLVGLDESMYANVSESPDALITEIALFWAYPLR